MSPTSRRPFTLVESPTLKARHSNAPAERGIGLPLAVGIAVALALGKRRTGVNARAATGTNVAVLAARIAFTLLIRGHGTLVLGFTDRRTRRPEAAAVRLGALDAFELEATSVNVAPARYVRRKQTPCLADDGHAAGHGDGEHRAETSNHKPFHRASGPPARSAIGAPGPRDGHPMQLFAQTRYNHSARASSGSARGAQGIRGPEALEVGREQAWPAAITTRAPP